MANDLNPIAHCSSDAADPQQFAEKQKPAFSPVLLTSYGAARLALDFEYWAGQLQERSRKKLGECYSAKDEVSGSSVAAYFWVPRSGCANPAARADPLIKQYWLSKVETSA